jgi:glyoxylase-like metal-dependent hydrolase (beta-lactamase superfamily II)
METLIRGLSATEAQPLPFDTSLAVRRFLLERDAGNMLLYGAGTPLADVEEIDARGGVVRRYLNHRHETAFGCGRVNAPLVVHADERPAVEKTCDVAAAFSRRHKPADDLEVVPTPGHTSGATSYLWDSGEHRMLFTGDTVYLRDGEWVAALLGSSDRGAYAESLELIRELDFDVLVPWASTRGDPSYSVVSHAEARRRLDAILARVRAGEDH